MLRTSRNLILLLAVMLGLGDRARAADASITISGSETQVSGAWDTGTITISLTDSAGHSYGESVLYGQYSTSASIASSFGARFSNDYYVATGLSVRACGNVICFHLKGADAFASLTISDSSPSFSVVKTVWQMAPVIAWATPASIPFGTALSSVQLNATASVPGTFVYSPEAGDILLAGTDTLSVIFTPTDTTDYAPVSAAVSLVVTPGTAKLSCW
jgi:hypothetical protein